MSDILWRALTSSTFWTAVTALATIAAVAFAAWYAFLTASIFALEQTPGVRLTRSVTHQDAGLIFKNVGRGPAIGIFFTDSRQQILKLADSKGGFRDSIDVLDPRISNTLGRYVTVCQTAIPRVDNQVYFIYYQDFNGGWHATKEYVQGDDFRSEFLGKQKPKNVPDQVRKRAQVVRK